MCEVFESVIEPPRFLIKCYSVHLQKFIDTKVNKFISEFELPQENKWSKFLENAIGIEKAEDEPPEEFIQAAFSVIESLKIRNEIKHELVSLQNTVMEVQKKLKLKISKPQFNSTKEKREGAIRHLNTLLCNQGIGLATKQLHRLILKVMKPFIEMTSYDGQVRHLLKVFLESMKPCIYYIT